MAKRGQNEGSIHKRSDGRWVAVLNLGYESGRRKRKYFYGDTRREVQERLTRALRDQQQGLPVMADERQTVSQYLTWWLQNVVRDNLRPKTFRSYEQMVRCHLIPGLGRYPLSKLAPQHVQAYLRAELHRGASARTVQYEHAILRSALTQAERWGLVPRNVAKVVQPPRVTRRPSMSLTPAQAQRLLAAAAGDSLEGLIVVALSLGLRQGEALGLRWQDIDLVRGELQVRNQLQRVNGTLTLVEPKTASSRRRLPLPTSARDALKRQRIRQAEQRLAAGATWQEHDLVFTAGRGTPLDATNVVKRFRKILERAGLPPMRYHDLRHACASLLLAQGVNLRTIMEILGHTQIATTADLYAHVLPAVQREAAELMDAALSGSA